MSDRGVRYASRSIRLTPAILLICSAAAAASCTGTGSSPAPSASAPASVPASATEGEPQRDGCGGALAFDAKQAPIALASAACATMPLASGSPWPISIRAAANAFRSFTGERLKFMVSGPFGGLLGPAYSLWSTELNPAGEYVAGSVDATTGMVLDVSYSAKVHDGPGPRLIQPSAARAKAADFLTLHSVDVTGLTFSEAPTDYGWEFTWEKMVGEAGVPPRVTVVMDWRSSAIVSFSRLIADFDAPPQARMTRQQAEAAALGSTWLGQPKVEASRLRYRDGGYQGKVLSWIVYVSGKGDNPTLPTYIEYDFDAITGDPI